MKDTKNSPFIHDISKPLVITGSAIPAAVSYVRFNHFQDSDTETGTYITDYGNHTQPYKVVQGDRGNNTGNFWATTGSLDQLDIYGEKVYTDEVVQPGLKVRTLMSQRGLSLPLSSDPVFISKDMKDLYSDTDCALTFMVKLKLTSELESDKAVIILADHPPPGPVVAATDVFSIALDHTEVKCDFQSVFTGVPPFQLSLSTTGLATSTFITVFGSFSVSSSGLMTAERFAVYSTETGEELHYASTLPAVLNNAPTLNNPVLYVGYGTKSVSGGVNNEFLEADFVEVDLAEIAIFDSVLTQEQIQTIARSHLSENQYKSGFNNRSPRRTQQLLDARTVYPASSNPSSPATSAPVFNDQFTKVYGIQPQSGSVSGIMYPEMLPAYMFSGSDDSRGAEGNVKPFYRDLHQTEYDKRLVGPGVMRQGLSHKETEILNVGTRNSPVVIGEDSDALGGTIEPFNDNHPLADKNERVAVSEDVIPGLNQRLGDHVAIIIDLNPVDDTTIGVERTGGAKSWLGETTGRVTSMAYFNFATRKWETAGKNNDFVIPGAITVRTGSAVAAGTISDKLIDITKNGFQELVNSSSVGFAGTSGFTIYEDKGSAAFAPLASRGAPVSTYGFPLHQKYEAKDDQLIDMSDYIDAPFVVERVAFEVGVAVEDSGPHSLGYKLETNQDNTQPGDNSQMPNLKFRADVDTPIAAFHEYSEYAKVVDHMNVEVSRGSFINGSWCIDVNDFSVGRGDTPGARADRPEDYPYMAYWDTNTLKNRCIASIFLGYQNHPRQEIPNADYNQPHVGRSFSILPDRQANPGFRFVMGAGSLWSHASYFGMAPGNYPARMMLPVVPGPRTASDPGHSPSLQGWNDGALLPPSRDENEPVADWAFADVNVSYIPLLAAGVNGLVTGSNDPTGIVRPTQHPISFVEKRTYKTQNWENVSAASINDWGLFEEPGVPFWRADTFFLLRQTKSDKKLKVQFSFEFTSDSSKVFFPLCPWATGQQPQKIYSMRYDASGVNFRRTTNREMEQMHGYRCITSDPHYGNFVGSPVPNPTNGIQVGTEVQFKTVFSISKEDLKVGWETETDTIRELVTFGQVTHYGYCAAQDGYVDKIVNTSNIDRGLGLTSGSWDSKFQTDVVDTRQALFGQAMKLSRMQTAGNSVIPADPHAVHAGAATQYSQFSDAPNSFQGSWSFSPGESHLDGFTDWLPSFTWADARTPGAPNASDSVTGILLSGQGRYKTMTYDGTSYNEQLLPYSRWGGASYYSYGADVSHSLDNWQPLLLMQNDQFRILSGSNIWYLWNNVSDSQMVDYNNAASDEREIGPLIPGGSGFSIISTPAWPIGSTDAVDREINSEGVIRYTLNDDQPYLFGRITAGIEADGFPGTNVGNPPVYQRYADFKWWGGFDTPPLSRPSQITDFLGDRPLTGWLQAGLGKEKNIYIGQGAKHGGTNIDYDDNWSGFTLMTASTVYRPWGIPGSENATLPLHANVYKRQWLNYEENLTFEVPIKTVTPTTAHDSGYWVVTAEDVWGPQLSDVEGTPGVIFVPFSPTGAASKQAIPWINRTASNFAMHAKRYHRRYTMSPSRGGYNVGPLADGFNSGRVFFRNVTAATQSGAQFQRKFTPSILHGNGRIENDPTIDPLTGFQEISFEDRYNSQEQALMTGSIATEQAQQSLYVLKPSDKLILGVQPSLPGWNAGSGLPNNRWSNKWGTWDYKESNATERVRSLDADVDGTHKDCLMNLEDPYEPCHGLTMLKGPSRIVLYGSFLRDNKHYSPSSKQQLRSAAVHEALHYDNPVLDQFLTDNAYEYTGNTLAQHITGSMLDGNRGVAGTLAAGNLTFSGSFQRFTRATEDSQVFYDTLPQDPWEIASIDGFVSDPNAVNPAATAIVCLSHSTPKIAEKSAEFGDAAGWTYAFSGTWNDSFPFESKYANVTRVVNDNPSFIKGPVDSNFVLGVGNGLILSGATAAPYTWAADNSDGSDPGQIKKFRGGVGGAINHLMITELEGEIDAVDAKGPPYNKWSSYSATSGIRNMANCYVAPSTAASLSPSANINVEGLDDSAKKQIFRTTFASIVGYGRQNRKILDRSIDRFYFGFLSSPSPTPLAIGITINLHPAGFKYGYMNCDHISPSTVHRADHYGQFRDMLEQRLYGKVYSFGDEYNKRGESESAVTCIFVDADGAPIDDATTTSCLNLSLSAASTKPFIEGEVLREIIINSESVTIE